MLYINCPITPVVPACLSDPVRLTKGNASVPISGPAKKIKTLRSASLSPQRSSLGYTTSRRDRWPQHSYIITTKAQGYREISLWLEMCRDGRLLQVREPIWNNESLIWACNKKKRYYITAKLWLSLNLHNRCYYQRGKQTLNALYALVALYVSRKTSSGGFFLSVWIQLTCCGR